MTTEAILTDEQVRDIIADVAWHNEEVFKFTAEVVRAIEQAVLANLHEQEPVAFSYELATTRSGDGEYTHWSPRLSYSMPNVPDGSIRNLKRLYASPLPAEPVKDDRVCKICDGGPGNECACSCGMRVWDTSSEPAKVPSDAQINEITMRELGKWPSFEAQSWACKVVKSVFARYGHPAEPVVKNSLTAPDGWQLVPIEINQDIRRAIYKATAIPTNSDVMPEIYQMILEASPKFGEEE